MNTNPDNDDGFYSIPECAALCGVKAWSIYSWSRAGKFPKIRKIVEGGKASGVSRKEFRAWQKKRLAK